jgi:uncharacterized protein
MTDIRPWYREPMVWLVIALPLSSIVAGTSLLGFALATGGDDPVPDQVRRMSQIQLANMDADRHASERGLQGELQIDPDTGALQLQISGLDSADHALALMFVHPLRAADDRTLPLIRSGSVWLGRFDGELDHAWQLRLSPDHQRWRIEGRLVAEQPQVSLRPRSGSG